MSFPNRIKAPSRATLDFLRDAVIFGTLGTTAGAGVLLLEERRRLIGYFQTIADNGRRLRNFEGGRVRHRSLVEDGDEVGKAVEVKIQKTYKDGVIGEMNEDWEYERIAHKTARRRRRKRVAHAEDMAVPDVSAQQGATGRSDLETKVVDSPRSYRCSSKQVQYDPKLVQHQNAHTPRHSSSRRDNIYSRPNHNFHAHGTRVAGLGAYCSGARLYSNLARPSAFNNDLAVDLGPWAVNPDIRVDTTYKSAARYDKQLVDRTDIPGAMLPRMNNVLEPCEEQTHDSVSRAIAKRKQKRLDAKSERRDATRQLKRTVKELGKGRKISNEEKARMNNIAAAAQLGDWSRVWSIIKESPAETSQPGEQTRPRNDLFSAALRVFMREPKGFSSLPDFFRDAHEMTGITPDEHSCNELVKSLIKTKRLSMIGPLVKCLQEFNPQLKVTPSWVSFWLVAYEQSFRPDREDFELVLDQIHQSAPALVTSRLRSVFNKIESRRLSRAPQLPPGPWEHHTRNNNNNNNNNQTTWVPSTASRNQCDPYSPAGQRGHLSSRRSGHGSTSKDPSVSSRQNTPNPLRRINSEMSLSLARGENDTVIDTYQMLLSRLGDASDLSEETLGRSFLEMALEACLRRENGRVALALETLTSAAAQGVNTREGETTILNFAIRRGQVPLQTLHRRVMAEYNAREAAGLPVKHYFAVSAATMFLKSSKSALAVKLLREIHLSRFHWESPFTIEVYTCLMTAYANMLDFDGLRWCLETIRARDVMLDRRFVRSIMRNEGTARYYLSLPGPAAGQAVRGQFRDWKNEMKTLWLEQRAIVSQMGIDLATQVERLYTEQLLQHSTKTEAIHFQEAHESVGGVVQSSRLSTSLSHPGLRGTIGSQAAMPFESLKSSQISPRSASDLPLPRTPKHSRTKFVNRPLKVGTKERETGNSPDREYWHAWVNNRKVAAAA